MFMKLRILTIMFVIAVSVVLPACETVDGAGRDIENAGESIQSSAQ